MKVTIVVFSLIIVTLLIIASIVFVKTTAVEETKDTNIYGFNDIEYSKEVY